MPSFGNIMEAVDMLQVKAVEVDQEKCSAVRNRNSRCRRCAEACIADAIAVGHNEVKVDSGACVNCGCCVAVCPASAIRTIEPPASRVEARALQVGDVEARSTVVACARKAASGKGNPEHFAEVPCLGHLTEGALLRLAAAGYDDIILVDGDCSTCKLGKASVFIDEVLSNAERLLDGAGGQAIITRQSSFPAYVEEGNAGALGNSRRGVFRQTTSYVKTVAGNVAKKAIDEKLGGSQEQRTMAERLRAGSRIATYVPEANYSIAESMARINETSPEAESAQGAFSTRHFGNVFVDASKCSGCGMCVMFCPTAALKYEEFEDPEDEGLRYLDFQAVDCTQCMLCKDVCLRECLEVSPQVSLDEILDFEPRLVEIARPKNTTNLAALARRNRRERS